jgi:hypothetical protein
MPLTRLDRAANFFVPSYYIEICIKNFINTTIGNDEL